MQKPLQYILAIISILTLCNSTASGQGTRIVYGEDSLNEGKYDRIYQMVSEQKVDINTQIKLDAVQWGQIQPSITIEQRIWKDITIEPNVTFSSLRWSQKEGIAYALNPNLDLKYYFNRARRERHGKNVIGFSADYFSFGMSYTLTDDKVFYNYTLGESYIELPELIGETFDYYSWRAMYGIQRKIGNIAYADIAVGLQRNYFGDYGTSKVIPLIQVKLGFALSTEQFKRFTR